MTRVLVVDDKEENVYYLSALLQANGFEVQSAPHGAEALALARRSPPDVVISDLLMPVMDGYTLLRQWKSDGQLRDVPFIVYTATYTAPDDEELALNLGADAFILKPTEPDDFLDRLRAVQASTRAASPRLPQEPAADETGLLRQYSETLIRKLEQKTLQLEESNRSLQRDVAARQRVELSLRESEASFRQLIEAMPQLVFITGGDGLDVYFNARWVEYAGSTSVGEHYLGWSKPLHPDDRAHTETAWKQATESGSTFTTEARLRAQGGSYRWWLMRAVPLRDVSGAVIKWFGTCTDIEEIKQSGARLQRTEEQLRQAQKMEAVGRLAGGVAHDFNNLLSVILGYTSLVLAELAPDSTTREELQEVQRAGERATDLTRQLLAFSRRQVLQPRVLDLSQVVADMENMLRRLLGEDIELARITSPLAATVHADPGQIEQIVMNLAVNARDAMPRGGKLTLSTSKVDVDGAYAERHPGVSPGPYVILAVTDTGTGIDAATRERMFEPFFTTKEKGKGTGLGLSTVFGIVNQSQGHIVVESQPGVGTTFKVYLPATDKRVEAVKATSAAPIAARASETILLAEDDEQVRTLSGAILRRHGYQVIEAAGGREAMLASESFGAPIHLLLTDVVMPHMSGRELANRLAPLRPGMKVLYVSGYTEDAIGQHGVLEPGIDLLQKPITPEGLLHKVREVLSAS